MTRACLPMERKARTSAIAAPRPSASGVTCVVSTMRCEACRRAATFSRTRESGSPAPSRPAPSGRKELSDPAPDRLRLIAHERSDHLAALEEHDGGHAHDAEARREDVVVVHVHLGYQGLARELLGEILDVRREPLAGAAPRGSEVDHRREFAG